jgi:CHAT domain-containing protein/tetratricopeptide (TPR) repeat protein
MSTGSDAIQQRIDDLDRQAFRHCKAGAYQQALEVSLQACELARQHFGLEHLSTAKSYDNLGYVFLLAGDLAGTVWYFEHSLAIHVKVFGTDHVETVRSLNRLGRLKLDLGELEGAQSLYERSLSAAFEVFGPEHPDTAEIMNSLGFVLRKRGDLTGARAHFERALGIRSKVLGPDHADTALSFTNLGAVVQAQGDLTGARPLLEQAVAITARLVGTEHPDYAQCLHNLGALCQAAGDRARARLHYEAALRICLEAFGPDHPHTADTLNNLGFLFRSMGDLTAAWRHHDQALAIRTKALGPGHPAVAQSLSHLGYLTRLTGDLAKARPYYEEALAIRLEALGPEHPETAESLNNLAFLFLASGDFVAARPLLEQTLAINRKVLGTEHPEYARSLNNVGYLHDRLGDFAQARPYYEQALELKRRALGDEHPDTGQGLESLAVLEAKCQRPHEALALLRQAAAVDDRMLGQVLSVGSEQQRLAFLRGLTAARNAFLSLVRLLQSGSAELAQEALGLILRRKAVGAEALAAQRDAILGGRYPPLRDSLDQLVQVRRQIAQKSVDGPGPDETGAAHQRQLDEWRARREQLESLLARQIPEMNLERQLRAADRQAVARGLPEDAVLVEIVQFQPLDFDAVPAGAEALPARYLAFVQPAREPDDVRMIDLGEAVPIDRMVADFRAWVTGDPDERRHDGGGVGVAGGPTSASAVGAALRQAVFDPFRAALGSHTRLLLCPDGDLMRLPFEVLPTGDGDRRLIDDYLITYLSSGRDVLRFRARPVRQAAPALVAADPDFDLAAAAAAAAPAAPEPSPAEPAARRWSRDLDRSHAVGRLPGTRTEGERIAALLGVEPWLDRGVLKARLKGQRSPRIVHLATHGFFLRDQPTELDGSLLPGAIDRLAGTARLESSLLRSGLLLAGYNTWRGGGQPPAEAEDGMLTAEDVTGMDLLDTELVVLSACETGLGEIHVGEGVFGLRRAFVLAGAKTLVMSLWKVPDEVTTGLMVDFYQRILGGEPRGEALRQAQLGVKARYPHPFYWGAFVCQGDPSPLPTEQAG